MTQPGGQDANGPQGRKDLVLPPDPPRPATILVAEDDEMMRKFMCAVLRGQGYTVLEAKDGATAETLATKYGVPANLLLTDYVMPDYTGPELARLLRAKNPNLKVLIVSGHVDTGEVQRGVLKVVFKEGAAFLQKPFTADDLARKVRAVLLTG